MKNEKAFTDLLLSISQLSEQKTDRVTSIAQATVEISNYFWSKAKELGKDNFAPYVLVDLWTKIQAVEAALTKEWGRAEKAAATETAAIEGLKVTWEALKAANTVGLNQEIQQILPILKDFDLTLQSAKKGESESIQRFIDGLKG